MDDQGVASGAILLMSLGEEGASEVFKHLEPREVQKLGQAMSALKNVTRARVQDVLARFRATASEQSPLAADSREYVRSVLTKALGEKKASQMVDRFLESDDARGIEGLKSMDAPSVIELIRNEHPQIIATILVHLERDQASEVLGEMSENVRNDVLLRIATLDGIQPTALRELNDVLTKLLSGDSNNVKKSRLGGARAAAEILNFMPGSMEGAVIESVKQYDADLAQSIEDQMFLFENLQDIDDRGLQLLLREIQSESLIVALKGASKELREKIFKNMSQRAADILRDDLEAKGPVRVSAVEGEQKEIMKIARRLSDEGQIDLGGQGDEAYV